MLAAKVGAALLVTLAAVVLIAVLAAGAAAAAGPITGQAVAWGGLGRQVLGALAAGAAWMLVGVGLGALVQHGAAALVACFVAPLLVTVAAGVLLGDAAVWIALAPAIDRLEALDLGGQVAPTLVALAVWLVLPLAVGCVRWLRRKVA